MRLRVCPFSVAVFVGTAAFITYRQRQQEKAKESGSNNQNEKKVSSSDNNRSNMSANASSTSNAPLQVVFVLGGPGAGKGTQCALLEERLPGWKHLSAGDLLRAERKKGGELGDLINARIAAGALVPSSVTCQLLVQAMQQQSGTCTKFLIDGFPRSYENLDAWNDLQNINLQVELVLCLECPQEVLTGRLLERGQSSGREDDANLQVISQRFATFRKETQPILDYYQKEHPQKLQNIASDRPVEQIYQQLAAMLEAL